MDAFEFQKAVARVLRETNVPLKVQPAVGGLRPDFLLETPDGRAIVVEAKSWDPTKRNQSRAIEQARLYQEATGADAAFVVVQGLRRGRPAEGLVTLDELADAIAAKIEGAQPRKRRRTGPRKTDTMIFAAMPFSPQYDDTYFVAMAPAAKAVNAVCRRVDAEEFVGDIVEEIKELIQRSSAVIADLSESRPNVLYEAGFAHGLGRPTIHICSTALDKLPFDVSHWNTIEYARGQTHQLKRRLVRRLKVALGIAQA